MEEFASRVGNNMTIYSRGEHELRSFLLQPRRRHPSIDVHDQFSVLGQHGLLSVSPLLLCSSNGLSEGSALSEVKIDWSQISTALGLQQGSHTVMKVTDHRCLERIL